MSRPRRGGRMGLVVIAFVAAVVGGTSVGGVTFARWSAQSHASGGVVVAGDLRVTAGDPTWVQTTPGVTEPASGTLTATPAEFPSMPGDQIRIRLPLTSYLRGDNLNAALTVDYEPAEDAEVTATYHVEDPSGGRVAPTAAPAAPGESVLLPPLAGSDAGVSQEWVVVIDVAVGGDYDWVAGADATPDQWSAGDIRVRLDQVRSGAGYIGGGA
ncbi:hypothetical protein [Microbacterium sp. NPDC096154]|uniref:hypothetical protein n=1 Tax=Microbacterium sp. NPDC096154 TaxID=3155549 RepID=UPI0033233008